MKVQMTARGVELSAGLREYVNRRIYFSLGRFASRVQSLSVRLTDVNGPRGGTDKLCGIRIDAGLGQAIVVRERQDSIHMAVALAMERVERALKRKLSLTSPPAQRLATRRAGFQLGD